MSFLKTLGLGVYYRLRRISKAMKNWKKFGVIIFGSLFIASSLLPSLADAAGKLTYLYVDPAAISIEAGKTYQFKVRAYDADWQTLSVTPTWTMAQAQAGTITSSGVFTAGGTKGTYSNAIKVSVGALSAYARVTVLETQGGNDDDDDDDDDITPPPAESKLTYLYVDPAAISVNAGKTYKFNYRAYDQNWKPITVTPTWAMAKSQAGSISSTGLFTAGSTKGTYDNAVKLSAGALSAYARVVVLTDGGVTPPPAESKLTYLYVDPAAISVKQGGTYTFAYRAYDQNWKPMTVPVTWSMNKPTAGTVNGNGGFTASQTKGTYENAVKVSSGALSAYARVVIYGTSNPQPAEFCSLVNIHQTSLTMYRNTTSDVITYTAMTNLGNPVPASDLVWNVNGGSFNTSTRRYTATENGDFTLTLQCRNNSAVRDTMPINVSEIIVQERYLQSVDINSDRNPLCSNDTANLSTQARDNYGAVISGASYYWELVSGVGYVTGDRYSQYGARLQGNFQVGTARVRVTATWNNRSVSNDLWVNIRDCSNPNPTPNYFIDGSITAVTENGLPACDNSVVVYTVRLTNRYSTSHNVSLSMPLPNGVTFMSATSAVDNPQISGRTIIWTPGTMAEGQTVTLTVKVTVDEGIRRGTDLKVSALVRSTEKPNGFYIYSNSLKVLCGTNPTPPLPPTGMEIVLLSIIGAVSLVLAGLTYRWLARRTVHYSI